MRYLAEHIGPRGVTLGTAGRLVRDYASDRNAFRFMHLHLVAGHFPAGQYRLYRWPAGQSGTTEIGTLYKLAESVRPA